MKKRIFSLLLVVVLCLSMVCTVYAGSASDSGRTTGAGGVVYTTIATLSVNRDEATATTNVSAQNYSDHIDFYTSLTFYYVNDNGATIARSDDGTKTAFYGNLYHGGIRAVSHHTVDAGGSGGVWSCGLAANAT